MRKVIIILLAFILTEPVFAQNFQLEVNSLALPFLTLDCGAGVRLGKGNSLSVQALVRPSRISVFRCIYRKYRGSTYTGPFIAASAGYLDYNNDDYEGCGAMISFGAGYRFVLAKRLDLSLEAGATLASTRDSRYIKIADPYLPDYRETRHRLLLIPFPISVSLIYLF